jgi:tripartite ATP-independent transporter DctM subunit
LDALTDLLPVLMLAGLIVGLFTGLPVPIVLMAISLIFGLAALQLGEMRAGHFALMPGRIFGGIIDNQILVAAPMFVLMGLVMERTRVAEDLLMALQGLLARVPGGLALSVVAMGTILAAATGIVGASVVILTVLALPVMLRAGYPPPLAAGIVAATGTLGIIVPPSIMLVFLGSLLSLNLSKLFMAALIPGLLLSLTYGGYVVLRMARARGDLVLPDLGTPPPLAGALFPPLVLIVTVLGSILGGFATPTEAAGAGAFAALVLGIARRRMTWGLFGETLDAAVRTISMLFFIYLGATAFAYIFRRVGGDETVLSLVNATGLGAWGVLAAVMALVFLLGFLLDWFEITLIFLPIFAPALTLLDFGGHIAATEVVYWFAILFAVNLQTSFLTPPFGFALFYLKGAAGDLIEMRDVYRGIVPFVLLQLGVLALIVAFPALALWLPEVLLK